MAEGGMLLYACDICGQDGLSDDEMRTHILLEHVEKSITCPFCDLQGTTLEEMNLHINAVHPDFMTPSVESKGFSQNFVSDSSSETSTTTSDWDNNKTSTNQTPQDSGSNNEIVMETSDESHEEIPMVNGNAQERKASFNKVNKEELTPTPVEMTVVNLSDTKDISISSSLSHSRPTLRSLSQQLSNSPDPLFSVSPSQPLSGTLNNQSGKLVSKHNGTSPEIILNENLDTQEQLKRRAKLHLNVPQAQVLITNKPVSNEKVLNTHESQGWVSPNKYVELPQTTSETSQKSCPMCLYHCMSADDMEIHVNRAHLDALTPSKPRGANDLNANPRKQAGKRFKPNEAIPSTSKAQYDCPICSKNFFNGTNLEKHVNTSHVDILSPMSNCNMDHISQAHSEPAPLALPEDTNNLQTTTKKPLCPICNLELPENTALKHVNDHFSDDHFANEHGECILLINGQLTAIV